MAADLYARYCEKATKDLGDVVGYASTMNEPDVPQLLNWFSLPGGPAGMSMAETMQAGLANVRMKLNAPEFADISWVTPEKYAMACWQRMPKA